MARIRTIKPEFFRHHDLFIAEKETKLPIRIAFAGLWTACDKEGRFRWSPEALKLDCLPYDNLDFSRVLDALLTRGFLVKYSVNGCIFGCIPTFRRHQVINNRERESEIPAPTESTTLTREPREGHACPTPLNLDQGEGEGKGREKEREGDIASPTTRAQPTPSFVLPTCYPGQFFPILPEDILHWQSLYPNTDVASEIRKIIGWLETNPKKKKTPTGTPSFVTRWLGRAQDGNGSNGSRSKQESTLELFERKEKEKAHGIGIR
jgi:hypothetical protein